MSAAVAGRKENGIGPSCQVAGRARASGTRADGIVRALAAPGPWRHGVIGERAGDGGRKGQQHRRC
jgi:hypothetical protein